MKPSKKYHWAYVKTSYEPGTIGLCWRGQGEIINFYHLFMPTSYLNFFLCSCFLSNPIVFWLAFFGPILAVILVNSMMFIIVTVIFVRQKQRKLCHEKKPVDLKTFIRPMISLTGIMILFGIAWLFAALAIIGKEEIRKPNEVLFVFFNSLQGSSFLYSSASLTWRCVSLGVSCWSLTYTILLFWTAHWNWASVQLL